MMGDERSNVAELLDLGLGTMTKAVEGKSQRRWDVGQGTYDGAARSAGQLNMNISEQQEKYDDLLKSARRVRIKIRN